MKKRNLPQIFIILFLTLLLSLPLTLTQTQASTLKAPKPAVRQINNYLQVSWSKVPGAQGYVIYTKNSQSASWKKVKSVGASTVKYNYKTVTSGKRYYSTVRAYRKTGGKTVYGAYSKNGVSCYYLTKPTLRISEKTHNSVTLSWNKISGATGYKIIRNDSVVADTKELKYTDSVEPNTKYTYTVRAYKGASYVDSGTMNVTTPKIPTNEAIETKVYEGENGYRFIEFKNTTNDTYYFSDYKINCFDSTGKLVWKVIKKTQLPYIDGHQTQYTMFKSPDVQYSYCKIEYIESRKSDRLSGIGAIKFGDIKIIDNEHLSVSVTNTSDKVIDLYYNVVYLRGDIPIFVGYGNCILNTYQSIEDIIDLYGEEKGYDNIKIQIYEAYQEY